MTVYYDWDGRSKALGDSLWILYKNHYKTYNIIKITTRVSRKILYCQTMYKVEYHRKIVFLIYIGI